MRVNSAAGGCGRAARRLRTVTTHRTVAGNRRDSWHTIATVTDTTEVIARNRDRQAQLYGEPLGILLGRVAEQLGLTQARLASILGLSAPMLSQLMSGQRIKIGNPIAVQRLQAVAGLAADLAAGRVAAVEIEARLAEIGAQSAGLTSGAITSSRLNPAAGVRTIQGILRAVAGADDLLSVAAELESRYPDLAQFLRVYGAGRTADALRHYEAHEHLL